MSLWERFGLRRVAGAALGVLLAARAAAMSEEELQALYLGVAEGAVEAFEPLWHEYSDAIPNTGFFDIASYGNWKDDEYISAVTIPLNGQLILCYSVLLNETDKAAFSALNVPRERLLEHAVKAIRWCCLTSGYVADPYPYPVKGVTDGHLSGTNWIRKHGRPVDVLGWYSVGVANLWDELDEETKGLVEQLMVGAAAKEAYLYGWQYADGGHHDRVKQDMASTIGAAFLFPEVDAAKPCREVVAQQCVDLVATVHDRACPVVADGKAVRDWFRAWNLYEDYSSDHHGWAQIWYGCDLVFEGRAYLELMSALTGRPRLEVSAYPGNGFDGVLEWAKGICLPEGEPASVHGVEYDSYYGAGLLAYCYGAVVKKDPVAAALEERAARLLESHIQAVGLYDYHRNSRAKAAAAYLMHKHAGPRAESVPFGQAWQALSGTYHHRGHQNFVHRGPGAWVSFAWDSTSCRGRGPQGYVVPVSLDTQEPLIYFMPRSLAGDVDMFDDGARVQHRQPETVYTWEADDTGFHTTGRARDAWLDRYCAFFCFGDGPAVLLTALAARQESQLSWAGVPICLYAREGITGPRTYRDAGGAFELGGAQEHVSDWWCVDERIGLAIAGGNGRAKVERREGYNWARSGAYRDKMDCLFASPIGRIDLKAGELGADVAAAVYPSATPAQVERAAAALKAGALAVPDGWRGGLVPDARREGRRYLAVANLWGAPGDAVLELACAEGAPVASRASLITGGTGRLTLRLEPLHSYGDTIGLYVKVPDGHAIAAERLARGRYRFSPMGGGPVSVEAIWIVDNAGAATVSAHSNAGPVPVAVEARGQAVFCSFTLMEPTVVEFSEPGAADHVPPFVDIRSVDVREDGRVSVCVDAADSSGIGWCELACDGAVVERKTQPPYVWALRPEPGWHTFRAVAADASPAANARASFKRTVEVRMPF
ncbi:MAG: hypothetical protein JXR94_02740 [Candidatus Hydrogenedentes bacterium]|nr:hypothetical protein [Candidatus Hydrogenedentota bacterium]